MKFHLLITFLFIGSIPSFAQQPENYSYLIYGLSNSTDGSGKETLTWILKKIDNNASEWSDPNFYTTISLNESGILETKYDFGIIVKNRFGPQNQYFSGEYYSNSGFGIQCGVQTPVFYTWVDESLNTITPINEFLNYGSWNLDYLNAPDLNGFFVAGYEGTAFYTYANVDSALKNSLFVLSDCSPKNYTEASYCSDSTFVSSQLITVLPLSGTKPFVYFDHKTAQLVRTTFNSDSTLVIKDNLSNYEIDRISTDLLHIHAFNSHSYIIDLKDYSEYDFTGFELIRSSSSIGTFDSFYVFNSEGVFITENRGKTFEKLFAIPNGTHEMIYFNNEFYALTSEEVFVYRNESFESIYSIKKTSLNELPENSPLTFHLNSVYPNPFNPSTTISFTLPQSSPVSIQLFDVNGRVVKIVSEQEYSTGKHFIQVNASDLSSGAYWLVLKSNLGSISKAITLVK
jgi:hypothetical protein